MQTISCDVSKTFNTSKLTKAYQAEISKTHGKLPAEYTVRVRGVKKEIPESLEEAIKVLGAPAVWRLVEKQMSLEHYQAALKALTEKATGENGSTPGSIEIKL